jgi:methionyl-tRNA formyltransferase
MQKNISDVRQTIIFASCKSWHKPLFERLKTIPHFNWIYAPTPSELSCVVDSTNPKFIFFLHWNWLVPDIIWQKHECICFHMSDVPYGRGGSPLQNLIIGGHKETKLTALKMIGEIDAGPVYTKRPLQLNGTAQEIYIRAGELSAEIIAWIVENEPEPAEQVGEVVLFKRRRPEQSSFPESGPLSHAYDFIRMLDADGYPHAFIEHGNFIFNLSKASFENGRLIAEVEIKKPNLSDS